MALPVIETFGLSKRYAKNEDFALRDLDLTVNKGEVYGFLGPNGAGKTTTVRLLLNFIQPTFGNGVIMGKDIVWKSTEIKRDIGYLSGEVSLYSKMTGGQFLDYMAALNPPKRKSFGDMLAKAFDADLKKRIGDLSKGNRQKIGLIQALMHEPAILILDEPTAGLDPLMQETFYQQVREFKQRGTTLFLSSHNLTEVQKVCDRVGFIRLGELIAEQSIGEFAKTAIQTYDVAFLSKVPAGELKKLGNLRLKINSPNHATILIKGDLKPLLALLSRQRVVSIDRREVSLEDEFIKFYKGAKS